MKYLSVEITYSYNTNPNEVYIQEHYTTTEGDLEAAKNDLQEVFTRVYEQGFSLLAGGTLYNVDVKEISEEEYRHLSLQEENKLCKMTEKWGHVYR
ncbi:hypothetical protein [Bacillus sp. C1]